MNRLLLASALLAAPVMLFDAPAQAASPISRCNAGGAVIYTDKACGALGAQPAPMSAELIRNLATAEAGAIVDAVAPRSLAENEEQASAKAYLAARHGFAGCARTPDQLQLLLRGAVTMGDVNRIASAYHWAGMGNGQAKAVLTRLESLGKAPVTSTHYYNATFGDAAVAMMSPVAMRTSGSGAAGFLQLVQNGGTRVTEFQVHKAMGCYFVSF
jgi:hypothetical protein